MTNSIVPSNFSFQSNTVRGDGLVNITALSSAYKRSTGKYKKAHDWLLTKEAKESIAYLEQATGITEADIVIVENGVGTWVHPDLAEIFAQWISVEYRFAVVQLIRVAKVNKPQQQLRQLPPSRDIVEYIQAFQLCGLMDDPMIRSLITQRACEELTSGSNTKSLPSPEQPLNVTSIASNLGFSQQAIGNGSKLGKHIAARHQPLGTSQHGKYQVNVYLPSEVESSVIEFFEQLAV
jgi:desulfoferrodoxin (superoxide reductase-like protein)